MHAPDPSTFGDSMIAATAQLHALNLVTRHVADSEGLGLALVNPFQA
jgi:predicted nucleic acid-binding protein